MDLDEIKSRINPQYQDVRGTESYERKWLCDEIERLRSLLQNGSPVVEGTIQHMAMEIAALKKELETVRILNRALTKNAMKEKSEECRETERNMLRKILVDVLISTGYELDQEQRSLLGFNNDSY